MGAALNHPVDVDETLGALSDLVHAGEIRAFGASNVAASEIVEAQWTAERRGRERFRTGLGRLLSSQNIVVATGGRLAGGQLTAEVRQLIDGSDGLIALKTRRENRWRSSAWIDYEYGHARGQGKQAIVRVEDGVEINKPFENDDGSRSTARTGWKRSWRYRRYFGSGRSELEFNRVEAPVRGRGDRRAG